MRWDTDKLDLQWLGQSATLHTSYYQARIVLHNPLPFIRKPSSIGMNPVHLESLHTCTVAANSCVQVLRVQLEWGLRIMPIQLQAAFSSAMVLLVGMWTTLKREGMKAKEELGVAVNDTNVQPRRPFPQLCG